MFRRDMTEEEVKNSGKELGNYIIEKLKSYGLYLDFREPEINFYTKYNDMSVVIWCFELTPDISESDEDVLGKFISHTFKEYINSHDFFLVIYILTVNVLFMLTSLSCILVFMR